MGNPKFWAGILVSKRHDRKSVLKRYLPYASSRLQLVAFTPESIREGQKHVRGLRRVKGKWINGTFPLPKAVYNRCYNLDPETIQRLAGLIGERRCFNQLNQFDKLETYRLLSRTLSGWLPETFAYDPELAAGLLNGTDAWYLKPVRGSRGKGVYRVKWHEDGGYQIGDHYFASRNRESNREIFLQQLNQRIGSVPYLIQREIPMLMRRGRVFDIRALVQKDRSGAWTVTNLVSRVAFPGCFNTSVAEKVFLTQDWLKQMYAPARVNEVIEAVQGISLLAAETVENGSGLHLGEISVDFTLDVSERLWIIEINGQPQKKIYARFRMPGRVYRRPMEYLQYLCRSSES